MQFLVSKTHPAQDESQVILSAAIAGSSPVPATQLMILDLQGEHFVPSFQVPEGQLVVKHLPNGAKRKVAPDALHSVQNPALSLHFAQLASQSTHFPVNTSANVPSGQVVTQVLSDFMKWSSLQTEQTELEVHFAQLVPQLEVQSLPNFPAGHSFTQVW
jgi:hypothetical protein